jgi:cell division protein FtsA
MKYAVTAIEFGSSKIACLSGIRASFGRYKLLSEITCPYTGFRKGLWTQRDAVNYAVSETIRCAEESAQQKITEAFVGVPGHFIKVVCKNAEISFQGHQTKIKKDHIEDLLQRAELHDVPEGHELLGTYPVYFLLDHHETAFEPVGRKASHLQCKVSHVIADPVFVRPVREALGELDIISKRMIATPLAQARMMVPRPRAESLTILLDVGYYVTDLSLVLAGALLHHATLQIGGFHLANDLALCLDMPFDEAEKLKRTMTLQPHAGTPNADKTGEPNGVQTFSEGGSAQDIFHARMEEMCRLINNVLDKTGARKASGLMLYLTGGGISMLTGINEYLKAELGPDITIVERAGPAGQPENLSSAFGILDFALALEDENTHHGIGAAAVSV